MRILVTGGAGMVGAHCAEYFVRLGHEVIIYDNLMRAEILSSSKKKLRQNWKHLQQYKKIHFYQKDIRSVSALDQCFRKYTPDVVIHAAGQPGVKFSLDFPKEDLSINTEGTLNVLEALKKHNPQGTFIYCSTNKVYGDNVHRHLIIEKSKRYEFKNTKGISETEGIDLSGHTPYGISKLAGDLYVQDYGRMYGMKIGVFRMSCVYGTRQFGFEDHGWIAWLTIRHILGQRINVYGDGKQLRDVLWCEDLAFAFKKFIESPMREGVFNIGGGEQNTLSLLELLDVLAKITGRKSNVQFKEWRKFDQKVYVSDIGKVFKSLDWCPTVSPQEGIGRMVTWVESNKALFEKALKI